MSDKEKKDKKEKKHKKDKDESKKKNEKDILLKSNLNKVIDSDVKSNDDIVGKVLVLFGSPKKNGHTKAIVDSFIKARNLDAEFIFVNSLNIKGCQGCLYCQSHDGECKPKDDMTDLYNKIKAARKIIMAFPVYYGSLPGEFKCMIDRIYAVSSIKTINGKNVYGSIWKESRDVFLIASHGNSIPQVKESVERVIKYFCVDTNSVLKGSYFSKPMDTNSVKDENLYLEDLLLAGKDF
jgi:putative NADPH-quinone reductase